MTSYRTRSAALVAGLTLAAAACGGGGGGTGSGLAGTISGDGSSTVFPIMEAVAEEFGKLHPDVQVQVGESGTGGGFEKFCTGEIDVANASRAIKDGEAARCRAKGVEYTEFRIASDGLSVVSSKDLGIDCLTVDELKRTFASGSSVRTAGDIRAGLPGIELKLFTPGADSGTYDFFLEEVLGKDGKFRTDGVTTSEDDNVLVQGIAGSPGGLGFFGFAYYEENADKLNLIGVDSGSGCVKPSRDTVRAASYRPLSRPLYLYVSGAALARAEVKEMLRYLFTTGRPLVEDVGYVQLTDADYAAALAKIPA